MDKKLIFVIGGARSGKSAFALRLAGSFEGPRTYIATAEALDKEMEERIEAHRKDRGAGWETVEEPVDIASRVGEFKGSGVVLIDCMTLWIANLIGSGLADEKIGSEVERLAGACKASRRSIIAVSNEVGLGVVPENGLARRFRDVSGSMNQRMAHGADEVFFIAAGLALKMK